jgi:hypothetical protein
MTWVLVLYLLHTDATTTTTKVPGFATAAQCLQTGQAWQSQANKRTENTDVAVYRCEPRAAQP